MKNVLLLIIFLYSGNVVAGASVDAGAVRINQGVNIDQAFLNGAKAVGIDVALLRALCFIESSHKPNVVVIMDRTAPSYGICQLQYNTAKGLGFKGSTKQLMYAPINILYAAKNLAKWFKKSRGSKYRALTSYNRGHLSSLGFGTYAAKVMIAVAERR